MESHDIDVTAQLNKFTKDFSTVLWVLTLFHFGTHYLLRKLNKIEEQLPKIVDLSAFRAKPN